MTLPRETIRVRAEIMAAMPDDWHTALEISRLTYGRAVEDGTEKAVRHQLMRMADEGLVERERLEHAYGGWTYYFKKSPSKLHNEV